MRFRFILFGLFAVLTISSGRVCAQPAASKDPQLTPLTTGFKLKPGYTLFMQSNNTSIPSGSLYFVSPRGPHYELLETYDLLRSMMAKIENSQQALAVAQFLTRSPSRFLLRQKPVLALDITELVGALPLEISTLFSAPRIQKSGEGWIIERDLVIPPKLTNTRAMATPQLVRSKESVKMDGTYTFSIKSVILRDQRLQQYLKYY